MSNKVSNITNPYFLKDIADQNEYCGVAKWHNNGITGKGVVVWNMETYTDHGCQTYDRIIDSAPNATILNGVVSSSMKDNVINYYKVSYQETPDSKEVLYDVEDFIKKFNVKIISRSIENELAHKGTDDPKDKMWCELAKKYNLIILDAADNEGNDSRNESTALPILVQAATLYKGKPQRELYSSTITHGNAFISFVGWNNGTSFSCPYMAGMVALLVERYGKDLTQEQVIEYFKAHCEDLGDEGYDKYYGYGLAMLGDVNEDFFRKDKVNEDVNDFYEVNIMKFIDVMVGSWYEKAVDFVTDEGYMSGFADGTFRPEQPLTRAQLAQVLYNIMQKK